MKHIFIKDQLPIRKIKVKKQTREFLNDSMSIFNQDKRFKN